MKSKWRKTLFAFKRQSLFSEVCFVRGSVEQVLQNRFPGYRIVLVDADEWGAPEDDDPSGGSPSYVVGVISRGRMQDYIRRQSGSAKLAEYMVFEGVPGAVPLWIAYPKQAFLMGSPFQMGALLPYYRENWKDVLLCLFFGLPLGAFMSLMLVFGWGAGEHDSLWLRICFIFPIILIMGLTGVAVFLVSVHTIFKPLFSLLGDLWRRS